MISIILFILAAALNAFMDSIETRIAFNASIFHKLNPNFWCKETAAKAVELLHGTNYRPDAWHIAKSTMVCCICAAICPLLPFTWYSNFILLGISWNLTFNVLYAHFKPK